MYALERELNAISHEMGKPFYHGDAKQRAAVASDRRKKRDKLEQVIGELSAVSPFKLTESLARGLVAQAAFTAGASKGAAVASTLSAASGRAPAFTVIDMKSKVAQPFTARELALDGGKLAQLRTAVKNPRIGVSWLGENRKFVKALSTYGKPVTSDPSGPQGIVLKPGVYLVKGSTFQDASIQALGGWSAPPPKASRSTSSTSTSTSSTSSSTSSTSSSTSSTSSSAGSGSKKKKDKKNKSPKKSSSNRASSGSSRVTTRSTSRASGVREVKVDTSEPPLTAHDPNKPPALESESESKLKAPTQSTSLNSQRITDADVAKAFNLTSD